MEGALNHLQVLSAEYRRYILSFSGKTEADVFFAVHVHLTSWPEKCEKSVARGYMLQTLYRLYRSSTITANFLGA